jgi:hypothetical protein
MNLNLQTVPLRTKRFAMGQCQASVFCCELLCFQGSTIVLANGTLHV